MIYYRDVNAATDTRRPVPAKVKALSISARMKWARTSAGFSHDRLVAEMGRSNRGHVIKIEKGQHQPRQDLRDAWADATNVPRDLFAEEVARSGEPFRGARSGSGGEDQRDRGRSDRGGSDNRVAA